MFLLSYKWSRNNYIYTRSLILNNLLKPQIKLSAPQIDNLLYQYTDMSGARTEKQSPEQRRNLPKQIFKYNWIVIPNIRIPYSEFVPIASC